MDAEEGEGEGDDASSMRSSRGGGSRGKVGRPCKAPKLPAKSGGQRKVYSGFNTVFLPLLLLAAGVGFLAACF